jgi:hypothetical protein
MLQNTNTKNTKYLLLAGLLWLVAKLALQPSVCCTAILLSHILTFLISCHSLMDTQICYLTLGFASECPLSISREQNFNGLRTMLEYNDILDLKALFGPKRQINFELWTLTVSSKNLSWLCPTMKGSKSLETFIKSRIYTMDMCAIKVFYQSKSIKKVFPARFSKNVCYQPEPDPTWVGAGIVTLENLCFCLSVFLSVFLCLLSDFLTN